jgi:hypothetical protein
MSGVALHTIATAATTLIANIVESRAGESGAAGSIAESQVICLKQCMGALGQLETSYFVTRRVRKIIQLVIRLVNLDLGQQPALPFAPQAPIAPVPEMEMLHKTELIVMEPPYCSPCDNQSALPMEMWDCPEVTSPFMVEDILFPTISQFNFLPFYESCYGRQ